MCVTGQHKAACALAQRYAHPVCVRMCSDTPDAEWSARAFQTLGINYVQPVKLHTYSAQHNNNCMLSPTEAFCVKQTCRINHSFYSLRHKFKRVLNECSTPCECDCAICHKPSHHNYIVMYSLIHHTLSPVVHITHCHLWSMSRKCVL